MFLHLDLLRPEDLGDHTVLVGHESCAERTHGGFSVHLLLTVDTESLHEFLVRVCDEREGQVIFCDELLVALCTLNAHADDGIAFCEHRLIVVPQVASLVGASRSRIARIDIEYELLALEVAQLHFVAILVKSQELRQFISYFHNNNVLLCYCLSSNRSPLFHKHEVHRRYQAGEGRKMVPVKALSLKEYVRNNGKDDQRDTLLDHFQLYEREGSAVALEADTVGGYLTTILKEGDAPRKDDDADQWPVVTDVCLLQFQMAIPGQRHKDIAAQQQCDGR